MGAPPAQAPIPATVQKKTRSCDLKRLSFLRRGLRRPLCPRICAGVEDVCGYLNHADCPVAVIEARFSKDEGPFVRRHTAAIELHVEVVVLKRVLPTAVPIGTYTRLAASNTDFAFRFLSP